MKDGKEYGWMEKIKEKEYRKKKVIFTEIGREKSYRK